MNTRFEFYENSVTLSAYEKMAQCESGSAYRIGVRIIFVNVYVVVDACTLFVDVLG